MRRHVIALAGLLLAVTSGCSGAPLGCAKDSECLAPAVCLIGYCTSPTDMASPPPEDAASPPRDAAPGVDQATDALSEFAPDFSRTCPMGKSICSGTCVNEASDPLNCGGCGHACSAVHGTPACVNSICTFTCDVGYADCNKDASDGCEVELNTDVANCGGCGASCSTANIAAVCQAGSCETGTCNPGFADCNGDQRSDGCEIDLKSDINHCGDCTTMCPAETWCFDGWCQVCCDAPGYKNCSGVCADGCDTVISSDPRNCGTCGYVCSLPHATARCENGVCFPAVCDAGWYCDHIPGNGCETDVWQDAKNCGACGNKCAASDGGVPTCVGGSCSP